jgi:hypothetical protein
MLLRQIERFLRDTDMPWTKFGRLATQDPRFVADLRNGRIPRDGTALRVQRFMDAYLAGRRDGGQHAA